MTSDEVRVGTIVSLSGPVPGLGLPYQSGVQSYVAYRNSIGGVCGRQISLSLADDGTDSARFRSLIQELEPNVLGLAGTSAGGDAGGADLVEDAQLPAVVAAFQSQFQDVSTVFDTNPPPADPNAVIGKYRFLRDQGVQTAALVTLSNAAAISELDLHQGLMEAAGIQVVSRQVLPVTTLSFDSAARAVVNSGAQYLYFLASETHNASMAQAMRDSGASLLFEDYQTGYGGNYIELAGDAAEGTTSWIRALPAEDGGAVAEQATFLQWLATTAPDVRPNVNTVDGWVAAKAFFDSLERLPGPITRQALLDQLRTLTSYDAGGLYGTINLAAEQSPGCLIGMQVQGGQWRRLAPASGFLC